MRAIDADALKEDLTRFYDNEVTARKLIDEQPTIQPEITHEQAVEYLQSTGWMRKHDLQMMLDGVHRLTVQPEPHWIPVTERLPEDDVYVLLTVRRMDDSYNHVPFISTGYISWNHQCWWCAHDGNCKDANVEVLAWMPLPEPFKGVTE